MFYLILDRSADILLPSTNIQEFLEIDTQSSSSSYGILLCFHQNFLFQLNTWVETCASGPVFPFLATSPSLTTQDTFLKQEE